MSEATRPLFEIGPGALMWGGAILKKGSPVPPALLEHAVESGGTWSIPDFEHCTRPVVKMSFVGANDDAAKLVAAEQGQRLAEDQLAAMQAELDEAAAALARERGKMATLEGEIAEMRKDLTNARRQVKRWKDRSQGAGE